MKASECHQRAERGASAVEYSLLVVGIAALLVIVIYALGGSVTGLFSVSCAAIAGQLGASC